MSKTPLCNLIFCRSPREFETGLRPAWVVSLQASPSHCITAVPKSVQKGTDQDLFSHAHALASMADIQHDNGVPTMVFCPIAWRCDRYLAVTKPISSPLSIWLQMEESFPFFAMAAMRPALTNGNPKKALEILKQILSMPRWERPMSHNPRVIKS